jgi:hypothetical protein
MRQYLGVSRFDVWADGKCYGSFVSPLDAAPWTLRRACVVCST